jgi:hypothetical protein
VVTNYHAEKFEEVETQDLVSMVLGNQNDMDGVTDGIPMAHKSVQELFKNANICKGDYVLEAGHGSYPRLAVLAAIITGMPTLAFEPYEGVFFNFRGAIKTRYNDQPECLSWKYPVIAANIDSGKKTRRKCTSTVVNYALNDNSDDENNSQTSSFEPSQTELSQSSSQHDCTQNSNESEECL